MTELESVTLKQLESALDTLRVTALAVKAERDALYAALKDMRRRWGRSIECSDPDGCKVCSEEIRITKAADRALAMVSR